VIAVPCAWLVHDGYGLLTARFVARRGGSTCLLLALTDAFGGGRERDDYKMVPSVVPLVLSSCNTLSLGHLVLSILLLCSVILYNRASIRSLTNSN